MNFRAHLASFSRRIRAHISHGYHGLMQIRDTPHAIAGGVAIGIFFSFTPLIGLRIILAVLIAWFARCSKAAAVIAVNIHEVIFYIWWYVWVLEFKLGYKLLHHHKNIADIKLKKLEDLQQVFKIRGWDDLQRFWHSLMELWPTFKATMIGSIIIGLPIAVVFYFLMLKIVRAYQKKIEEKTPHS